MYSSILDNPQILGPVSEKNQQSESEASRLSCWANLLKLFSASLSVTEAFCCHYFVISSQICLSKRDPLTRVLFRHLCTHGFHSLVFQDPFQIIRKSKRSSEATLRWAAAQVFSDYLGCWSIWELWRKSPFHWKRKIESDGGDTSWLIS